MSAFQVHFEPGDKQVTIAQGESVVEAAIRAGLTVNYGCSNGACGLCVARLLEGSVRKIQDYDYVFERGQRDGRFFLMCCHTADADLRVEAQLVGKAGEVPLQHFRARLRSFDRVGDELAVFRLRVSRSHRLRFIAGQAARLHHPRCGDARLPIASCPCDASELEFHVRRCGDDPFTQGLFDACRPGDWFDVEAPHGGFVFTEDMERPVALFAFDTGFAPVKSLVEHIVAQESELPIRLYRACIGDACYLDNLCCSWRDALDQLDYTVLPPAQEGATAASAADWAGRILADHPHPVHTDFYLCAPPAVVARMKQEMMRGGAAEARVFCESPPGMDCSNA